MFGVGLMATAGYLISRAAEQPPILALTTAIVAVRFFGLARPIARYFERLASHDLALRSLARIRGRFYERIEPLAPAQLESYRHGELLDRMVGDVDALQGLYLRGLGPPLVAVLTGAVCVGVAAAILPVAAVILAAGLLVGGLLVPVVAARLGRATQAPLRCARDADRRADRAPARRARARRLRPRGGHRSSASAEPTASSLALARRDAFAAGVADSLAILVAGATVVGVLAAAVAAHNDGELDRVLRRRARPARARLVRERRAARADGTRARRDIDGRPQRARARRPRAGRSRPGAAGSPPHDAPSVALERVTAGYGERRRF